MTDHTIQARFEVSANVFCAKEVSSEIDENVARYTRVIKKMARSVTPDGQEPSVDAESLATTIYLMTTAMRQALEDEMIEYQIKMRQNGVKS